MSGLLDFPYVQRGVRSELEERREKGNTMSTLNRKKPFGEIWGGNVPARFHQDGRYFDHEGKQVDLQPHHYDAADTGAPPQPPRVLDAGTEEPQQQESDAAAALASLQAALAQRRSTLMLQAIPLLEAAQAEVVANLPDHDADLLAVMLEVENLAKKRKTVLDGLASELVAKQQQAAKDAALPQNAPSATFGTMGAQSQLAAQLG